MGISKLSLPHCVYSLFAKMTKKSRKMKAQKKLAKLSKSRSAVVLANQSTNVREESCSSDLDDCEQTTSSKSKSLTALGHHEEDEYSENDDEDAYGLDLHGLTNLSGPCNKQKNVVHKDDSAGDSQNQREKDVTVGVDEEAAQIGGGDTELDIEEEGLMLIVGPEKFTTGILKVLQLANNNDKVKLKCIPELKSEDAVKWRNASLASVLFVVDYKDEHRLKAIDDTLSILSRNYLMSMEFIDFILVKESVQARIKSPFILGGDILDFMLKYNRPLVTVIFEEGWELNTPLMDKLQLFLQRFQLPTHSEDGSSDKPKDYTN